jgi:hypothetical protein
MASSTMSEIEIAMFVDHLPSGATVTEVMAASRS